MLVVFTDREGPSDFYQSFVADGIKLDIRRLNPSDVISIALSPERQDQQNVRKLRGLSQRNWEKLVNLVEKTGNQTPLSDFYNIMQLTPDRQEAEALAARSNMTGINSRMISSPKPSTKYSVPRTKPGTPTETSRGTPDT